MKFCILFFWFVKVFHSELENVPSLGGSDISYAESDTSHENLEKFDPKLANLSEYNRRLSLQNLIN